MIWANRYAGMSPSFNGRRQPSRGGTSRINREVCVRFCERLGVKFPGPCVPSCEESIIGQRSGMSALDDRIAGAAVLAVSRSSIKRAAVPRVCAFSPLDLDQN